jgi:hypothetical protein
MVSLARKKSDLLEPSPIRLSGLMSELEVPVGDLYKDALMKRINQRNIL